ncbi:MULTISPECIES: 3-methyl-2-oxobutanoate hydroxymethyltransferase [unclassified Thioalkalivibrio]|uniref:3-methyl-2-oxobutanoate hydroxymethyltransferase n=1 Tax=unclassified Thioalkalivibrio TaxID=2621013 RepID=UPI00019598C2|nr:MULTISPECIES: 3-methyl-2-oxobutanoate hydroxymethyltransferase [unclassified Thioalkalivibrio]ADC72534.1 3-methyl-2-oxobutanoate hydroxymethyltransferase [Thioalkalivibrio sp. K90mix]
MRPITVNTLARRKQAGEPITCLTAYDASFAALLDRCGVDVILVGDSLGMVVQGHPTTLPVTIDDMCYHVANVARVTHNAMIMADLPFLGDADAPTALQQSGALLRAGAHMVKVECGLAELPIVERLVAAGIPVCAHLGLTPQAVHRMGGYRVQGRDPHAAAEMESLAARLEAAGAQGLLLESVPEELANAIVRATDIPVIGIGASPRCDGQVLVIQDVIGLTPEPPRFARDFLGDGGSLEGAVRAYCEAVRARTFPESGVHTYR